MINVSVFLNTFSNFAVFFLLCVTGSLWGYYCFKRNKGFHLGPAIIICTLCVAGWGMVAGLNVDEIEHLHCSWLTYRGLIPFKDFWQHHAPILWVVLAPFFSIIKPGALLLVMSRIFSGFLYACIVWAGWRLALKVWQGKARPAMYLLIACASGITGEFLFLRPDLCNTLFLLLFIYICLEIGGKRIAPAFFAGAAFGLASSFIWKQYLLFFLPLFVILKEKSGARAAKAGAKACAYFLGVCFGALPLILYLVDKDIVREFIFWVFSYNRKRVVISADFPLAIGVAGVWGAYLLLRRYRAFKDTGALVLLCAFCLSTGSSLTHTLSPFFGYNIGLWLMLCAVVGSGLNLQSLIGRLSTLFQRSIAAGLFLSLIVSPQIVALAGYRHTNFSADKKAISQLIAYGSGNTCLAILPYHPIFAFDATRLYSFWQLHLSSQYPELKKEIMRGGLAQELRSKNPAVVLSILDNRDFLLELFQKGLIARKEYNGLTAFFKDGYTLKIIGRNGYFIRNDKL